MNFSYYERNKPVMLERKGSLLDFHLCPTKENAERIAGRARAGGSQARVYERGVKVDGIEILLHVVIVRARKAKP